MARSFCKEKGMKRFKKITSALSVIALSIAFAALTTYLTTPEDERPDIAEVFGGQEEVGDVERHIAWDELPDEVIAWVEVPDTSIDEPIVQATPDAPNAYLYRDAMGQGAYGTPYIDCECTLESPFAIVYGHHMSDGSAFADFAGFIDETYAREHSEIIVYRRDAETLHLKPVAVDVVNASREKLVLDQELKPSERISGTDLILETSSDDSQLIAFATCSYQTWNSRTIVFAVQTES